MNSARTVRTAFLVAAVALPLPADSRVDGPAHQTALRVADVHRVMGQPRVAFNEPHVAVDPADPDRVVVAAIATDDRPQFIATAYSRDGGLTWQRAALPRIREPRLAGDPWLAWPPGGPLFLGVLVQLPEGNDTRSNIWVYASTDGGATWNEPTTAPRGPAGGSYDHEILVAASSETTPTQLVMVATQGLSSLSVLRQDASGRWQEPLRFTPDRRNNNLGGAVVVDSDIVFSHFDMSTPDSERPLWSVHLDAGGDFTRTLIRRGVQPWGFPPLAADPGSQRWPHRLYAAWLEGSAATNLDVFVAHSNDLGASWSDAVRVNSDRTATFRGFPALAVNSRGVLAIQWIDRRHTEEANCSDLYVTASLDGGESFLPETRVTAATGCPRAETSVRTARRWPGGGDYHGLVADGHDAFRLAWSDSRSGEFEIWTTTVQVAADLAVRPR